MRSADGQQRIDVVVRQATTLKRTLFQVTGALAWLRLQVLVQQHVITHSVAKGSFYMHASSAHR